MYLKALAIFTITARFDSAFGGKSTSDLSEGSNLYYTDARVQAVSINNVVEDTTPQLGGDLASNGNDILFGDNDKAVFGAGSDLQIYSDGTNGIIQENTGGSLYIAGADTHIMNSDFTEYYISAFENGAVWLRHDNSLKLSTTSTGIDVTGTVTADGVTSDGNILMSGAGTNPRYVVLGDETNTYAGSLVIQAGGGSAAFGGGLVMYGHSHASKAGDVVAGISAGSGGSFRVNTSGIDDSGANVLDVNANGDISFYEDTGTTAKFFWDASAESLGIGTTSPDTQLTLYKASTNADVDYAEMRMDSWAASTGKLKSIVWNDSGSNVAGIGAEYDGAKTNIHFHSQYNGGFKGTSDRTMSIMGNGNVGIGTASPSSKLDIQQATAGNIISAEFDNTDYTANNRNAIKIRQATSASSSYSAYLGSDKNTNNLFLANDSITANHLVINSSGKVGIGIDNPSQLLSVSNGMHVINANAFAAATDGAYCLAVGARSGGKSIVTTSDIECGSAILLGGTASANRLDDYEEGSWTPTITGSTTAGSYSNVATSGNYTKVGNLVTASMYFYGASGTGAGNLLIGGLPFSLSSTANAVGVIQANSGLVYPASTNEAIFQMLANTTTGEVRCNKTDGSGYAKMQYPTTAEYIRINITYKTG